MCRIVNFPAISSAASASSRLPLRTSCRKPAWPRFFFIGGFAGREQCWSPSHSQWETAAKFAGTAYLAVALGTGVQSSRSSTRLGRKRGSGRGKCWRSLSQQSHSLAIEEESLPEDLAVCGQRDGCVSDQSVLRLPPSGENRSKSMSGIRSGARSTPPLSRGLRD